MRKGFTTIAALVAALATGLVLAAVAAGSGGNKLGAQLRGANETPAAPASNRGRVEITLKASAGKVCWEFYLTKIDGKPNAAHIHKGRPGVSGPVFIPLGTTFKRQGCYAASKAKINAVAAKPGAFYVNVHNAKHPAGAMRGQLTVHA
jgi:CHRD domain